MLGAVTIVSIHVPARGTTLFGIKHSCIAIVSIHVPARGTTDLEGAIAAHKPGFQSTFPQGERRAQYQIQDMPELVSIHVPARGTTVSGTGIRRIASGFNPRSRKGNDRVENIRRHTNTGFNPRSRKGNDISSPSNSSGSSSVSIHVPARGTTYRISPIIV